MVTTYDKSNGDTRLSKNFIAKEFACKCHRCTSVLIDGDLVQILQQIRDHFKASVKINSGYRCEAHNTEVGGHSKSAHMDGMAADIRVVGQSPASVAKYAEFIGVKRIGLYEGDEEGNFVHIGSGKKKRFWRGHAGTEVDTFSDPVQHTLDGYCSTGSLSDEKTIWDFLYEKIGNPFGTAGLMGNLFAESGLRSNNLEQRYENSLSYTDTSYTAAVDSGLYSNFIKDSAGYGLAQWTYWSRKKAMLEYHQAAKKSIGDLCTQLEFLYKELSESYKDVLLDLRTAKNVLDASNSVLFKFERPANQGESVQKKRAEYGQRYYDKYAGQPVATKPETTGTPEDLKFKVGDIVNFNGTNHYASANASTGPKAKASKAKITAIHKDGRHPYHCRAVNDAGKFIGGVYGWVNAADLSAIVAETPATEPWVPKVGDIVNYTGNKHYANANAANGSACKGGKAKITNIYQLGKSKHPYHLVRVSGKGATVWGWVDEGTFTKA